MKWEWEVEGQLVTAEANPLSGREIVRVDQTTVSNQISFRFKNEVVVPLGSGREARVTFSLQKLVMPSCSLAIDGKLIAPSRLPPRPRLWWQWVFVAACAVIPLLTAGGGVPALIGIGGAMANWKIATSTRSTAAKAAMMAVVTALAWMLLLTLVWMISRRPAPTG